MAISLALACSLLTALAFWRSLTMGEAVQREGLAVRRCLILLDEAERYRGGRQQLAAAAQAGEAVVELGTQAVRTVHQTIASIPFGILESIPVVREPTRIVRALHDAIAGGVYDSIGAANQIIGKGLRGGLRRPPISKEKKTT